MVSVHDKWIRIFEIPDVKKHKSGFTIYKIVSMLYPESCPDAVTKVTVWKRYNDFRRLHRALKSLYKILNKNNKDYPSLPARTLLKRFDDETIQERKQSILNFLDFIGGHYQLFTSKEFVKFLESSHTPAEHLNSNIISIRAELQLPEDPEVCTAVSDDDVTLSDTDSVSTMCSLSSPLQVDILSDSFRTALHPQPKLHKFSSTASLNSHTSSNNSDLSSITNIFDSISLLDGQSYNIPLIKSLDDNIQYILDASVHVNLAAELEEDKKYDEAHVAYNTAIDILTKHGNDDPNYDRKQLVKYKINKYRIRADKIYNMYLSPEIKTLEIMTDSMEESTVKRPLFDLYKFRVVKIINSGILVLHSELQKLFYVKVIHKTTQFLNENLILPENVPYMVKLESHYNCENALFLVLEYCSGMKLSEYLRRKETDKFFNKEEEFTANQFQEDSDNDSEGSFSDLIQDYNSSRQANSSTSSNKTSNKEQTEPDKDSTDGSFEKVDEEECVLSEETLNDCQPSSPADLVRTDQFFYQKYTRRKDKNSFSDERSAASQRKLSEISSTSNFDFEIFSNRLLVVSEKTVVKWASQLLLALEKLHALGVICRDLQLKNIMIDDKEDIMLTYMCNIKEVGDLFSSRINYNLAPEVYSFYDITTAADWYSYGAILYELLVGLPLSDIHMNGINSCSCLKIPRYVSPQARSILKQLLAYDPQDRLGTGVNGTENIKSHPFFKSIPWDSLI